MMFAQGSLRQRLLGTAAVLVVAAGIGWADPAFADFAAGSRAYEKRDFATAYREWLPLARGGDASAQRNIGQLYRLGQGVPKDPAVAVNWYRLAAEQGLDRAQANLGVMYLNGEGVERDYVKAAEWFKRAADQGHAISQYNLALLYDQGLGVEKNRTRAVSWLQRASENGHERASERLAQLLNDKVAPGAGSTTSPPPATASKPTTPAQPVRTARASEYLPEWLRERPPRPTDRTLPPMPAGDGAARAVDVARAEPTPAPSATARPGPEAKPSGPTALAGTADVRLAVRPSAPRDPATPLPKANNAPRVVPEIPELANLRQPKERPAADDKPVPVRAVAATPSPPLAPPPRPEAQVIIPVPALIKAEADRDPTTSRSTAAVVVPPSLVVVREAEEDARRLATATRQPEPPVVAPSAIVVREAAEDARRQVAFRSAERAVPGFLVDEARRNSSKPSDDWREPDQPEPSAPAAKAAVVPPAARRDDTPRKPEGVAAEDRRPSEREAPLVQREATVVRTPEPSPAPIRETPAKVAAVPPAPAPPPDSRRVGPLRDDERLATPPLPAFLRVEAEHRLSPAPDGSRVPAFLRHEAELERRQVAARVIESAPPADVMPPPAFLRSEPGARRIRPFDEIPVPLFLRAEAELDFLRTRSGSSAPPLLQREAMADAARTVPRFNRPNLSDPTPAATIERERRETLAKADNPAPAAAPAMLRQEASPPQGLAKAVEDGVAAYLTRDYAKALTYWRPAAEAGHAIAQYFMGGLHLDGHGVPRNLVTAYVWFSRAEAGGHRRASDNLALLRRVMTDVQYAEAVNRAKAN